jgi:hypothetical protein
MYIQKPQYSKYKIIIMNYYRPSPQIKMELLKVCNPDLGTLILAKHKEVMLT